MNKAFTTVSVVLLTCGIASPQNLNVAWIHGSESCAANTDSAFQVHAYDRKSKILLTGDTVYPGRLYIRDWTAFNASVERLAAFVKSQRLQPYWEHTSRCRPSRASITP